MQNSNCDGYRAFRSLRYRRLYLWEIASLPAVARNDSELLIFALSFLTLRFTFYI